jgi:hypothetical protein
MLPAEDAIRNRAHELYLTRLAAGQTGDALGDWLQAERELCSAAECTTADEEARPDLTAAGPPHRPVLSWMS